MIKFWGDYVAKRATELPEELRISPKVRQNMWAIFNAYKQRNSNRVEGTIVLDFLNEYVKIHRLNLAIDPEILLKQVHPFHGHLTKLDSAVTFEDVFTILEHLILASFEKLQGQTLLASEICAYAYWRHRDRQEKGYLGLDAATGLLKTFDIKVSDWAGFAQEFEFSLKSRRSDFLWGDEGLAPASVLPFDFFRHIYLERNF